MKNNRRRFSTEFKQEAIALVRRTGKSANQIAHELGVNQASLSRWIREAESSPASGRSMGDSHRHLRITDEEWQAFMDDFQQTLDKFGVPVPEQGELKAIVESTKEAIVVAPFDEGPAPTTSNTKPP